jgi:hypothetical protein
LDLEPMWWPSIVGLRVLAHGVISTTTRGGLLMRCVTKVMAALGVVPVMLTQTPASALPYNIYPWCALSQSEADSHASAHVPKQAQLGAAWRRLADTDG